MDGRGAEVLAERVGSGAMSIQDSARIAAAFVCDGARGVANRQLARSHGEKETCGAGYNSLSVDTDVSCRCSALGDPARTNKEVWFTRTFASCCHLMSSMKYMLEAWSLKFFWGSETWKSGGPETLPDRQTTTKK